MASRGSGRISEEPSRAALGPLSCGRCVAVMYSKVGESSQREARRELPQRPPPSPASPSIIIIISANHMAWLLPEGEESKQGESTRSAGREEWDEGVNGGGGRGGGKGCRV